MCPFTGWNLDWKNNFRTYSISDFYGTEKYTNFVFRLKISCNAKIEAKVSTLLAMHSKAIRL